jgi:hypothetical protein
MYSPVNGAANYQIIVTYETDDRFIHVRNYLLTDEEYREVLANRSRIAYYVQRETERTTNEDIINAHERANQNTTICI